MSKWLFLVILLLAGFSISAQTLRLATYRYDTNTRINNLQPLADELQKQTGREIMLHSYHSVPDFIKALQTGQVDIGLINTFGYLLYQSSAGKDSMEAKAVWVVPEDAKDVYRTSFIAKKGSGIEWNKIPKTASFLRLSLVAEGSTSGNLIPRLLLSKQIPGNLDNSFAALKYEGTHHDAVMAVVSGKSDLAAMGQDAFFRVLNENAAYKDQLQEIRISPEIPLGPVLINSGLDQTIKKKILECLLNLHRFNPLAMNQIRAGWTEARKATHFEEIHPDHYSELLRAFGTPETIAEILRKFAR